MADPATAPEHMSSGNKGLFAGFLMVVVVAAVAGVAYYVKQRTPKGLNAQDLRVERLTWNGKAATVAISPDGQNVAYVLRTGAEQSVILRRVRTGEETELLAPEPISYAGLTFSPDGTSLYYTASSKDNHLYSYLYKIPIEGG